MLGQIGITSTCPTDSTFGLVIPFALAISVNSDSLP